MAYTPESKPPFWSSLPGIFTGLAGVIAAITGLITVLYTTGVISPKSDLNAVPPVNSAVTIASTPAPAASPSSDRDNDRYKDLAGKWEVVEAPSQIYDVRDVKSVTWRYEATVSGTLLTLKGKIYAVNKSRNLEADDRLYEANLVTNLKGLNGEGEYTQTNPDGGTYTSDATIQFKDGLKEFDGDVKDGDGKTYKLKGRKL